jgi:transcriptional regulator with XRE-family HTH domain
LETLGKRLKRIRKDHKLSLFKVASGTMIHNNYLQRLEAGKAKNPSLEVLTKLADFYGISIDELVGHKINKNPKYDWWMPDKKQERSRAKKRGGGQGRARQSSGID